MAVVLAAAGAQTPPPESLLTPDVIRIGSRLSCRCGACRNTVGDCAMLHCGYCMPKRERIFRMKQEGLSDDQIVNTFVKEEGIVTLSAPPSEGIGPILSWVGPGVALLIGFGVYFGYVRRNRKAPAALAPVDQEVLNRFQAQIDRELDDSSMSGGAARK